MDELAECPLDVRFCGFVVNALVFVTVSVFTRRLDQGHVQSMAADMDH